jgi:diguanylate cyclase (GGDEF)-like protein
MSQPASLDHSHASTVACLLGESAAEDATRQRLPDDSIDASQCQESCLVQIYPPDVVDGMRLLQHERIVAGRDATANLRLHDSSVSRRHAEFERDQIGYLVRDLGSTNGTHVNGELVSRQRLQSGDTLRLGSFLFKFLSAGSIESQYHETVYTALTRDALTGTMNKRYLMESMQREVARSIRQHLVLSVLMLDIDHFKSVNGTHGHLVGDEVLREFGGRILTECREDDLLARYGGEEFCLLLSATCRDEAREIAERCRVAISHRPFETAAGQLDISASFGLACLDPDAPATPTELIHEADLCLYDAKRNGRNMVCG